MEVEKEVEVENEVEVEYDVRHVMMLCSNISTQQRLEFIGQTTLNCYFTLDDIFRPQPWTFSNL